MLYKFMELEVIFRDSWIWELFLNLFYAHKTKMWQNLQFANMKVHASWKCGRYSDCFDDESGDCYGGKFASCYSDGLSGICYSDRFGDYCGDRFVDYCSGRFYDSCGDRPGGYCGVKPDVCCGGFCFKSNSKLWISTKIIRNVKGWNAKSVHLYSCIPFS